MSQDEVGLGIVGLDLDCVFGAQIGGVEVAAVFVELRYAEVFCDAFVVGLEILDLGEFAAGGSGAGGAIGRGGDGGGASGSAALLSLELLLELLLLLYCCYCCSSPNRTSGVGVWVGNGCSSAAVEWGFEGGGASGAALLLSLELLELLLPESESRIGGGVWVGNGCSSAAVAGDFETQGLSVAGLPVVWLGDGHGGAVSVGFWVGVVWATQAAESNMATSME